MGGFDRRLAAWTLVQSTQLVSRLERSANLPGVEFDNHVVAVHPTSLLDSQTNERERSSPVTSTALLRSLSRINVGVIVAYPSGPRSSCSDLRDANFDSRWLSEKLSSKISQRTFFR
jgi:hypothetical protein